MRVPVGIPVLAAMVVFGLPWRAEAIKEVEPGYEWGMAGVSRSETVRLTMVNLGTQRASRMVIDGGKSASLELDGATVDDPNIRPGIRASVRTNCPSDSMIGTMEVFDSSTGQGNLILHPAVIKGFNPQPDPPGITR
jgi:hypothetical protein